MIMLKISIGWTDQELQPASDYESKSNDAIVYESYSFAVKLIYRCSPVAYKYTKKIKYHERTKSNTALPHLGSLAVGREHKNKRRVDDVYYNKTFSNTMNIVMPFFVSRKNTDV